MCIESYQPKTIFFSYIKYNLNFGSYFALYIANNKKIKT